MPTSNIIDAILNSASPEAITEAFADTMKEISVQHIVEIKRQMANKLFSEDVEEDMVGALDFVYEGLDKYGPSKLQNILEVASRTYGVPFEELHTNLIEDFGTSEYSPISEGFLETLVNIISQDNDGVVTFQNNAARRVSVQESNALLSLWVNLSDKNKSIMEQTVSTDPVSFKKLLDFAIVECNSVDQHMEEDYSTGKMCSKCGKSPMLCKCGNTAVKTGSAVTWTQRKTKNPGDPKHFPTVLTQSTSGVQK